MSAAAIATQVQAILQSALGSLSPTLVENTTPINVALGIPMIHNDNVLCYVFHDGSRDVEHAGPGVIRRSHRFPVHLMIRSDADPLAAETVLLTLHDVIVGAFYSNRRLNGTASTSQMHQLDAELASKVPFIRENVGGEYRQRWFVLEVGEDVTYTYG